MMSSGADMLTTLDAPSVEIDEFRADAFNLMQGDWSPMDSKRNFSRSRSSSKGRRTDYAPPVEPQDPTA